MNNELWYNFVQSGSVQDYLIYRKKEQEKAELTNADYDKGIDNQGASNGGE